LDAYELLSASQLDDTLHKCLLLLAPHLLRVIFTRDTLPWEHKNPKEWRGKIVHIPALDDLALDDAELFLRKKNIDNPDLQEHLYRLTGGYPLHLELCADICREIEETSSRKPTINDFEGAAQTKDLTDELVHRLLRQLKDDERDLMRLAVYPRWFSEEILEILSSVPESVSRIFKKFIGLSMISLHPEITGVYVIRKEVRESLLSRQRKERLWPQQHRKLATYHSERWQEHESFLHLLEFLHHSFCEDPDKGIKIFEEYFWRFLDEFGFGKAESLLQSIPPMAFSETMKRKVDYARVRLLTVSRRSQQSLAEAKKICEKLIASEEDETLLSQYFFSHGELLDCMGEYENALEFYQKALAIELKIYGEKHPKVALSYNNIGIIYYRQGAYDKALEFHQKSLAVRQDMFEGEHPAIAQCYNNIGLNYWKKGEYEKALEYFQKTLGIEQKIYGERHPKVARSYNNIGIIYYEQGEYDKALDCYDKVLDIYFKTFGEEHPEIASAYNNMGVIYCLLGEYKKALDYHEKSLTVRLKIYGTEHPDTAYSYFNIGQVYWQTGEHDKALKHFQKSLDTRLKIFGDEHPDVAASYNNIGVIYYDQEVYDKALEFFQRSLTIRLKVFDEKHPEVAYSYINLGNVYRGREEYSKALDFCQKGLAIRLKNYGEEHPLVASVCNTIGNIYAEQDEFGRALEYLQKSFTIRLKNFGEKHPDVAESYRDIAYTLRGLKRDEEALEKMRKSVDIYCGCKLWKNATKDQTTLAQWLQESGRYKDAEEARMEAQKMRQEHDIT
jgi:tetratricopeptide (TPR) repeat protein